MGVYNQSENKSAPMGASKGEAMVESIERKRREPWGDQEKRRMINRLSRIEGQIKGIKAMVEADRHCGDVLNQVAAAEKGLRAFGVQLARSHFITCVEPDIREGGEELAQEFLELFSQLAK